MNIRHLFSSVQIAMICLLLVSGTANAKLQVPSPLEDSSFQDNPLVEPAAQSPLVVRPGQDVTPRPDFTSPQDQVPPDDQTVMINDKYAGWQEVTETPSGERLSDVIRGNWIMIDPNGRFEGQVAPGAGADVTQMNIFLMNMGRLVKQTTVDANGRFEFTNVRQGAYSLIGWGKNGFFAFGLNILAYNPENASKTVNTINVTAYQNKTTINTDWIQFFAPQVSFRVFGRYPTGEGRDDPATLFGFSGLYQNAPVSVPATSISSQPIVKTADDRVLGRVHQVTSISGRPVDVRSTKVMLFQGDSVVASTTTDNFGGFAFSQVPDGSYGVTAVGVDGVGMIAIDVVSNGSSADALGEDIGSNTTQVDFTMISSETIGWLNNYATEVAYRRALMAPRPVRPVAPVGCPNCGNPGCTGCQCVDCNSRCMTFDKWARSGCQCKSQKFGEGYVLEAWAKQQREYLKQSSDISQRAFYPEGPYMEGILREAAQSQPYPTQQFGN